MESGGAGSLPSDTRPVEVFNSIRERTIAENSMVVLLQGLQGEVTTVDLRNESTARGRVVNVDAFMNIRLEEVVYRDWRAICTWECPLAVGSLFRLWPMCFLGTYFSLDYYKTNLECVRMTAAHIMTA
uniref:Sm domain-containing protein n=1 Tax=Monopterus albus TaxID=43700 RepID=A0A3Q3JNF7_MONAL